LDEIRVYSILYRTIRYEVACICALYWRRCCMVCERIEHCSMAVHRAYFLVECLDVGELPDQVVSLHPSFMALQRASKGEWHEGHTTTLVPCIHPFTCVFVIPRRVFWTRGIALYGKNLENCGKLCDILHAGEGCVTCEGRVTCAGRGGEMWTRRRVLRSRGNRLKRYD
jgi:hypothetical protein